MKNTGLKNEELLKVLQKDGSSAVKPRNEFGVYLFDEADPKDGIVFSKLSKPKYIESELLKSIDTNITELLPITASELAPTILLEIYNEVTASLSASLSENDTLKDQILGLSASLSELESEMDELLIINDSLNLNTAVAENTLQLVNVRLASNVEDLQNAIQRATNESISRAELQATNDILERNNIILSQEIDQLRTQLDTLVGLGFESLNASPGYVFNESPQPQNDQSEGRFLVSVVNRTNLSESSIHATQNYQTRLFGGFSSNRDIVFVNGPQIRIQNLSVLNSTTVSISKRKTDSNGSVDWILIPQSQIILSPGESKTITLRTVKDWSKDTKRQTYNGSLVFTSTQSTQTLNTSIRRRKV